MRLKLPIPLLVLVAVAVADQGVAHASTRLVIKTTQVRPKPVSKSVLVRFLWRLPIKKGRSSDHIDDHGGVAVAHDTGRPKAILDPMSRDLVKHLRSVTPLDDGDRAVGFRSGKPVAFDLKNRRPLRIETFEVPSGRRVGLVEIGPGNVVAYDLATGDRLPRSTDVAELRKQSQEARTTWRDAIDDGSFGTPPTQISGSFYLLNKRQGNRGTLVDLNSGRTLRVQVNTERPIQIFEGRYLYAHTTFGRHTFPVIHDLETGALVQHSILRDHDNKKILGVRRPGTLELFDADSGRALSQKPPPDVLEGFDKAFEAKLSSRSR
jgi:hypothetical protein